MSPATHRALKDHLRFQTFFKRALEHTQKRGSIIIRKMEAWAIPIKGRDPTDAESATYGQLRQDLDVQNARAVKLNKLMESVIPRANYLRRELE